MRGRGAVVIRAAGGVTHAKPRRREGKRKGQFSVFGFRFSVGRAADGSPRVILW